MATIPVIRITPVNAYSLAFRIDQMYGKMDFTHYLSDKHTLDFGASSLFYDLEPGKYLPMEGVVGEGGPDGEGESGGVRYLCGRSLGYHLPTLLERGGPLFPCLTYWGPYL